MKKLKLKHLAPYLPYGLNTQFWVNDAAYVKLMVDEKRDKLLTSQNVHFVLTYCKPILRPLSDLTKEIEVNGEKFVPLRRLNEDSEYPLLIEDDGTIYFTDACELNMLEITSIYDIFQKLYQWHFDVFGLIPEGLAIDINTLNK